MLHQIRTSPMKLGQWRKHLAQVPPSGFSHESHPRSPQTHGWEQACISENKHRIGPSISLPPFTSYHGSSRPHAESNKARLYWGKIYPIRQFFSLSFRYISQWVYLIDLYPRKLQNGAPNREASPMKLGQWRKYLAQVPPSGFSPESHLKLRAGSKLALAKTRII